MYMYAYVVIATIFDE